jgi:hypothetical protein
MKATTLFPVLFALLLPAVAQAGLPNGGDENWNQEPGLGDDVYELQGAWTDRSNSMIHFESSGSNVTIDTQTNRAYFANGAQLIEVYIPTTLAAGGFDSSLNFQDVYPGAGNNLYMTGILGDGPIGPCDLSPCVNDWDPITGSPILVDVWEADDFNLQDFLVAQDQIDFNNWRERECQAFDDSLARSLTSAPAVGIACAAGEGIGPETACAAGWLQEIYQVTRRASQGANCGSQYPGPGRWRGSTLPQGYGQ